MDTTVNFVCESLSSNESKQNPQSTTEGHEVSKRPVPPPSRPFRVYRAPGQAKAKEAKEHPPPPSHEVLYPLPPFRQTPGPIQASQTYLRTLVLECWDAEIRRCHEAYLDGGSCEQDKGFIDDYDGVSVIVLLD
ncbi:hypothetical protein F4604DRAFT_1942608 [Suillus subluteus]|nr:hypothetical protein F4604DRAFT_1942608 [Suillus subluteus]